MYQNTVFILINRIRECTLASIESYVHARTKTEKYIISYNGERQDEIKTLNEIGARHKIDVKVNSTKNFYDHALHCSKNLDTRYITLLHDDDILKADHFKILKRNYSKNVTLATSDIVYVANKYKKMSTFKTKEDFITPLEVLTSYLLGRHAVAFPAIVYKKEDFKNYFSYSDDLEKYSDAKIIYKLAIGGLMRVDSQTFIYVIHEDQDSKQVSTEQKKKLNQWIRAELMKKTTYRRVQIALLNLWSILRRKNV